MRMASTQIDGRFSMARCLACLACLMAGSRTAVAADLISAGSVWKYRDNGSNQGTVWRNPGFDDSAWPSGPAQLGYGDGDEATTVAYGPNASAKYITTYFRRTFMVADPAAVQALQLALLRDDGAVVYLNGTEVHRSNMLVGPIGHTSVAPAAIGGADESAFHSAVIDRGLLVPGMNTLAVEVHQQSGTSSDISIDLRLSDINTASVVRGPYLQRANPTGLIVRWRTDLGGDGRVRYGLAPDALTSQADDTAMGTEHRVVLTGLSPDTLYYYSVGTSGATLAGDATYSFRTPPVVGTSKATRIWVLGDPGTANADARRVRDSYYAFAGSPTPDLWLMLGDNAYESGTDSEYQAGVFDTYPATLRSSVLWPTLGNHDGVSADSATLTGPYYDIFSLPRNGESGGLASGTEAYYSFDYANIHFVCLESHETNRSPTGPMMTWLTNDLAATTQPWIIAFWHHPPYSKGSHDSDASDEPQMREMRANALPILEAAGVDLVLTGHSHAYERSHLIDGHYGDSDTLTPAMVLNNGGGNPAAGGGGRYAKATLPHGGHEGAVYAVAGSSGKLSDGPLNHPVMYFSLLEFGSMVLDIRGNRMDASFLDDAGGVRDRFAIVKGPGNPCGSADFDGDGDVGTDLDIEAFYACIGGNCCPACGSPDFDGDGDQGTDADIAAFFRVLGGGNC